MHQSNYNNFLVTQCANCSLFLTSENIKLTHVKLKSSINGSNKSDISNAEAISYVYGLSINDLAEKLKSYFIEDNYDCSLSDLSESLDSTVLVLCENCSPVFEELYEVSKQFRNLSDKNSLLWKILEERGFEANYLEEKNYIKEEEGDASDEAADVDPGLANEGDLLGLECWNDNGNSNSYSENELEDVKPDNVETNMNWKSDDSDSYDFGRERNRHTKRKIADISTVVPSNSIKTRLRKRKQDIKHSKLTDKDVHKDNDGEYDNKDNLASVIVDFTNDGNSSPMSEASEDCDLEYSHNNNKGRRKRVKRYDRRNVQSNVLRGHYVTILCKKKSTSTKKVYEFRCSYCPCVFTIRQQAYRHYYLKHFEAASFHSETIPGPPFKCPKPKCTSSYIGYHDLQRHCARWHLLKLPERSRLANNILTCEMSDLNTKDGTSTSKNIQNEKGSSEGNEEESNPQPFAENIEDHNDHSDLEYSDDNSKGKKTIRYDRRNAQQNVLRGHYATILCKDKSTATKKVYKFRCNYCPSVFTTRQQAYRHYYLDHFEATSFHSEIIPGPPFKCPQPKCTCSYNGYQDLQRHCARWHLLKLPERGSSFLKGFEFSKCYTCSICGISFQKKTDLNQHKSSQHADADDGQQTVDDQIGLPTETVEYCDELFFCRSCKCKFKSRYNILVHHHRSHKSAQMYDCKNCDSSFVYLSAFLNHMSNVHNEHARPEEYCDVYTCMENECNHLFYTRNHFNAHQRVANHSGCNITCAFCEDSFAKIEQVNIHKLKSHKGRRAAKTSMKRPAEQQSFNCAFCDQSFQSKLEEQRHRATHPKEEQIYKCHKCDLTFATRNQFYNHSVIHLNIRKTCETCGKTYNTEKMYRSHMREHLERASGVPWVCEICGRSYPTRKTLLKHKNVVHERRQEKTCHLCGYVSITNYYMKKHLKVHEKNGILRPRKKEK